jgi:hypothetical protein
MPKPDHDARNKQGEAAKAKSTENYNETQGKCPLANESDDTQDKEEARKRRLEELSYDEDRGGIDATSRREAEAALGLEEAGKLPAPVRRPDKTKGEHGDFVDGQGQLWDHKGPMSRDKLIENIKEKARQAGKPEPNINPNKKIKGEFDVNKEVEKVKGEIANNENVILDTRGLNNKDEQALRKAIADEKLEDNLEWYP